MYKPKKGDAIVIRRTRSVTDAKMKTTRYDEWCFGRAFAVTRKGVIEKFCYGKDDVPWTVDRNIWIRTIADPNLRAAAGKLCNELGSKPFDDEDAIKDLIVGNAA